MKSTRQKENLADYFGVLVEVVCRMENCSLIRFRGKSFIVETADLVIAEIAQYAA